MSCQDPQPDGQLLLPYEAGQALATMSYSNSMPPIWTILDLELDKAYVTCQEYEAKEKQKKVAAVGDLMADRLLMLAPTFFGPQQS